MTSRERVQAAYDHLDTDRVPTLFKNDEALLTEALIKATGVSTRDEMLLRLGIDTRVEAPPYTGPALPKDTEGNALSYWGTAGATYT